MLLRGEACVKLERVAGFPLSVAISKLLIERIACMWIDVETREKWVDGNGFNFDSGH
jgi:hypothetical protein